MLKNLGKLWLPLLNLATVLLGFASVFVWAKFFSPADVAHYSISVFWTSIAAGFLLLRIDFQIPLKNTPLIFYGIIRTVLFLLLLVFFAALLFPWRFSLFAAMTLMAVISTAITYELIRRSQLVLLGVFRVVNVVFLNAITLAFALVEDRPANALELSAIISMAVAALLIFYRYLGWGFLDFRKSYVFYFYKYFFKNCKSCFNSLFLWCVESLSYGVVPTLLLFCYGPVVSGVFVFFDRFFRAGSSVFVSSIVPVFVSRVSEKSFKLDVYAVRKVWFFTLIFSVLSFSSLSAGIFLLYHFGYLSGWEAGLDFLPSLVLFHVFYVLNSSTSFLSNKYNFRLLASFSIGVPFLLITAFFFIAFRLDYDINPAVYVAVLSSVWLFGLFVQNRMVLRNV